MSKYQELIDSINKTSKIKDGLKLKVNRDFVEKFSKYLGCDKENIIITFKDCKYLDKNKLSTLDFTLSIKINLSEKLSQQNLDGFSNIFSIIVGPEVSDHAHITYNTQNYDLEIESEKLFSVVFKAIYDKFANIA